MNSKSNQKFGKGLSSLLGEKNYSLLNSNDKNDISLDLIITNSNQPRKNFDSESLNELVQSIKQYGILQPILVRKIDDKYEIIAGERRFRAAKLAGLETIPAIVKEFDDRDSFSLSIIENIQRENLNAIEEANAYKDLIDKYGYTQQDISDKVGKSRSHIANLMRLLNLPESVQKNLAEGKIEMGHARALINCDFAEEIVDHIIENGLNVREVEKIVQEERMNLPNKLRKIKKDDMENEIKEKIKILENKLNMRCNLIYVGKNKKYNLNIEFTSLEELDNFIDKL
jgi:ParB family chromosome partitioning protein